MLEMTNRRFFFCLAIAFVIGCLMTSAGHKRCPEPNAGTYEQGYAAGQSAAYADCFAQDEDNACSEADYELDGLGGQWTGSGPGDSLVVG